MSVKSLRHFTQTWAIVTDWNLPHIHIAALIFFPSLSLFLYQNNYLVQGTEKGSGCCYGNRSWSRGKGGTTEEASGLEFSRL